MRVVGSPDILEFIWGKKKGRTYVFERLMEVLALTGVYCNVLGANEDEENVILRRKDLNPEVSSTVK